MPRVDAEGRRGRGRAPASTAASAETRSHHASRRAAVISRTPWMVVNSTGAEPQNDRVAVPKLRWIARWPTAVLASRRLAKRARALELRELDWIAVELAGIATPESTWLEVHVERPPVLVCASYQVQLAAIRAGLGVGIGPRLIAELDRDFVVLERLGRDLPVLDLHIVTRRAIRNLPRVATVMGALSEAFGSIHAR